MSKLIWFNVLTWLLLLVGASFAQPPEQNLKSQQKVRTMTIPISISSKQEKRDRATEEFIEAGDIKVSEDGDDQTILSIRSVSNTPLALEVLIQDDLSAQVNLQLKDIADFIRKLPKGSRVMVAYLRGGTVQVRQKFTDDTEKAAKSLRIIASSAGVAAGDPYTGVEESLDRFDALPSGRRAVLLISDGLDISRGAIDSSPSQSLDLQRAINKAQRKSVAVYSIYASATLTDNGNSILISNAQGSLERLSDETGGRAFFQGFSTPVSFSPYLKTIDVALTRQFALTYLSTHLKKGYHKVQVTSTNPDVKIEYPKGYYFR